LLAIELKTIRSSLPGEEEYAAEVNNVVAAVCTKR
jgi:hypothetical protein